MTYEHVRSWRHHGSLFGRVQDASGTFDIELTGSLLAALGEQDDDDYLVVYFEDQVIRQLEPGRGAVYGGWISSGGRTVVRYIDGTEQRFSIDLPL